MPEIALRLLYAAGMIYRFNAFELDLAKLELRADDAVRPVEPQVFALLALLVSNRERVVSRDEIIETVWDGRVVSDSAIDSRIKSARQALGDDGTTQRFIKTIQRKGFRFVAEARAVGSGSVALVGGAGTPAMPAGHGTRPSIAVLPFRHVGVIGPYASSGPSTSLSRSRICIGCAKTFARRLSPRWRSGFHCMRHRLRACR